MNEDELKQLIIQIVSDLNGCKATELPVHLTTKLDTKLQESSQDFTISYVETTSYIELLTKMIKAGDLIAVEYVLPNHRYRTKTFLLPKGTEVNCAKVENEA